MVATASASSLQADHNPTMQDPHGTQLGQANRNMPILNKLSMKYLRCTVMTRLQAPSIVAWVPSAVVAGHVNYFLLFLGEEKKELAHIRINDFVKEEYTIVRRRRVCRN